MAINYLLIKIILAGLLFGSLIFIKNKNKWILALILTAYLILLGAEVI